jgi:hypothetical protein
MNVEERLARLERDLAPIVAELTATRQQLVSQAETIGTLRAELAPAISAKSPSDPSTATPAADAAVDTTAHFAWPSRRWYAALFVTVMAAVMVALLLVAMMLLYQTR